MRADEAETSGSTEFQYFRSWGAQDVEQDDCHPDLLEAFILISRWKQEGGCHSLGFSALCPFSAENQQTELDGCLLRHTTVIDFTIKLTPTDTLKETAGEGFEPGYADRHSATKYHQSLSLGKRHLRPSAICQDLGHQAARAPGSVRISTPDRPMNSHPFFKTSKAPSDSTLYHLLSKPKRVRGRSQVEVAAVRTLGQRYLL